MLPQLMATWPESPGLRLSFLAPSLRLRQQLKMLLQLPQLLMSAEELLRTLLPLLKMWQRPPPHSLMASPCQQVLLMWLPPLAR